jgi:hypothetical protein
VTAVGERHHEQPRPAILAGARIARQGAFAVIDLRFLARLGFKPATDLRLIAAQFTSKSLDGIVGTGVAVVMAAISGSPITSAPAPVTTRLRARRSRVSDRGRTERPPPKTRLSAFLARENEAFPGVPIGWAPRPWRIVRSSTNSRKLPTGDARARGFSAGFYLAGTPAQYPRSFSCVARVMRHAPTR